MASRKRRRLSAWGILARLGHNGDDRDEIVQHVFDATARLTLRGDDGEPLDGDDYLVGLFEALGTTKTWPSCGSPEWERLRYQALTQVVRRLGREGLYDCISVGGEGTPALTGKPTDGEHDASGSDTTETPDGGGGGKSSTTEDEELVSDDGDESRTAKDKNPDPRAGVQVLRAYIRRGQRNPDGWFRGVDRMTPYKVIARWASQTCPGVATESLVALLDALREVRWWDDDGHIIGGEMLRVLESELEAGCGHEQWMLVVSDFEDAVGRLRRVFEKLCLV